MSQEGVLTGTGVILQEETRKRSVGKRAWQMLRRARLGLAGAVILLAVVFVAIAAPIIAPYDPKDQDLRARLTCPIGTSCVRFGANPPQTIHGSAKHFLGTDHLGRDIWTRILYG